MIFDQKQQWRWLDWGCPLRGVKRGAKRRQPPLLLFLNYARNNFQIYYQGDK